LHVYNSRNPPFRQICNVLHHHYSASSILLLGARINLCMKSCKQTINSLCQHISAWDDRPWPLSNLQTCDDRYFIWPTRVTTRNSSGNEIANVNFLYDDIVHAVQNTIDSCINPATDRRGCVATQIYQIQWNNEM